jgi:hypothetical protein
MESSSEDQSKEEKNREGGGFTFNGPVNATTMNFVNGDVENLIVNNQGLSANELRQLDELFLPLREQVRTTPQTIPNQVEQQVQDLHAELAKGQSANADRVNKIIDRLVEMVPGALGALVTMFANPILGSLVGPVTQQVLKHLQG